MERNIDSAEALEHLKQGNARFVSGSYQNSGLLNQHRRSELAGGQDPWAVVLGCSDSRVPAEIIFDLGLGDLFVIRVAGNIVAPSQVGSIEFAVEKWGTPLVVVLGHTHCGAIDATLAALLAPETTHSFNVNSIVSRIKPTLQTLVETNLKEDSAELAKYAVRANIRASVSQVLYSSPILEQKVQSGRLVVVGAQYDVDTGVVDFLS